MKNLFKCYLAGPITGLSYGDVTDWRNIVSEKLDPIYGRIVGYSPMRAKQYLQHETSISDDQRDLTSHGDLSAALSSDMGIITRDLRDVKTADIVLMNLLGAKTVSIGTMIEFGAAAILGIPIVLVMERKGNIHDHCIVRNAPFIVHDLDTAVTIIHAVLLP